jgi:protein-S-isoprenylcysteine O-methyltransferase Ste14
MTVHLEKLRQGKLYDFLMGLPLIYWFGYVGVVKARPSLVADARAVLADPASPLANLQFCAFFASLTFNILTIYLVVARTPPVRRSKGYWGRFFGVTGTFLGVGIQRLDQVHPSLPWLLLSAAMILGGSLGSVIALSKLGKSFAIMPEARQLVTGGPYAYARHPLYAMELITIAGSVILFRQPWASLLGLGVMTLLVVRTFFEEQVLLEAYPEYAQYRARVKRFGLI